VDGGTQYDMLLEYYLYQGNWWLLVIDRWIGYYPASLFSATRPSNPSSTLAQGSDVIFFYGEIVQSDGSLTTTGMGSRRFANAGNTHAAYIRKINYLDTSGTAQSYNVEWSVNDSSRYSVDTHAASGTNWASYVYLGGVVGG